jgi:surfactin synthase thioesterase subunit
MNGTVVDILFYLSKAYRNKILKKVCDEANKYYIDLYKNGNNPRFKGKVSIVGHSLGTVITYDLLLRQ